MSPDRIEQVARERQRLWGRLGRGEGDTSTSERVVALTRWLNGHAGDIRSNELPRYFRMNGMYADKRLASVEAAK